MAIKIDLEKAYDRVRWDFIDKSIQATGISGYLRTVIMSAITTTTMKLCGIGYPLKNLNLQEKGLGTLEHLDLPPPRHSAGADEIKWMLASSGKFTIKNAYQMLTINSLYNRNPRWKVIWKYLGPQRIQFFLWLACKQRLLTNLERARRGLNHSTFCPMCRHNTEDVLHTLRDCSTIKEIWLSITHPSWQNQFFSNDNIFNWVEENLKHNEWLIWANTSWPTLFGIVAWRIWKNRNFFVF
ncbi:hypothetical protein PVK06_005544 [Gossypium arboreum]|uniref:Reverse transcriptase zinc-binding domain-containing protein n=1 Tax=Gossypium arboreum TaxID=29729 RepID=A0ABR0QVU9_GOSAR|nr:hypothetical protein PVK06_005544 [Gossypium arboreum]